MLDQVALRTVIGRSARSPFRIEAARARAATTRRALLRSLCAFSMLLGAAAATTAASAAARGASPILERHTAIPDARVSGAPTSEADQIIVDGWPMYRTERGQEAFNHAMATLAATAAPPPSPRAFRGCEKLRCPLDLPKLDAAGWIPAGRLWLSPDEYVVFVHSPRTSTYDSGRRRGRGSMRYFIFHEFQNSNGNTDLYDTISAHRHSVFVPFYLGKPGRDAAGRRFVIAVQVAPHDIVSRHASNLGSAGPGIEVAKNRGDALGWLQATAGVLVASIVKAAVPRLRVVNHRNTEGLPMLEAYRRHIAAENAALSSATGRQRAPLRLPFTPAHPKRVAAATASLAHLIAVGGIQQPMPRNALENAIESASGNASESASESRPAAAQPALASLAPRLLSPPELVHVVEQPALTIEHLLERVLQERIKPEREEAKPAAAGHAPACQKPPRRLC